jgi:peptidoglycan/xylan/chitin deacetylase (PgdA/CDA1 family)
MIAAMIARYDRARILDLLTELRRRCEAAPETLAQRAHLHLDAEEIVEMSRGGITFGNHSASHAVLPRLNPSECQEEIERAQALLATLPGSIPSLAYPFGRGDAATERIAWDLGYTTLMEVEGDNDPLDRRHVGRLNVTSIPPSVLFARMELVAPLKFRAKRFWQRLQARSRAGHGPSRSR